MTNDMQSRTERAETYIRKCRRRRLRALRRRERNRERSIILAASIIGYGGGTMALIMVGIVIGGWLV